MVIDQIRSFFTKGHERSIKAKKNIAFSLVLRGVGVFCSLAVVPVLLGFLGNEKYGVWLTLSSIILWFNFFDVGLGHGLRNKLSESLASDQLGLSRRYISTSYIILSVISISLCIIFFAVSPFLNWSIILNTTVVSGKELFGLVLVVFVFFSLRLTLELLYAIIYAKQQPALKTLVETSQKVLILVLMLILPHVFNNSFFLTGVVFSVVPVFLLILSSIILFTTRLREIAPKLDSFDRSLIKDLFSLGGRFFIIQIAAVVLFSTDNIIISQLFSPAEVSTYYISQKYFSVTIMVFVIIITPFWSAITEAFAKGELVWIRKTVNKLIRVWIILVIVVFLLLFVSDPAYRLWVGDKVVIPFDLSLSWAIFISLQAFNLIFVHFLNGLGKVKLQMITGIFSIIFNIPLSIIFAKYFGLGVKGVLMGTFVSILISTVLRIVQYNKIINHRAKGIWDQ